MKLLCVALAAAWCGAEGRLGRSAPASLVATSAGATAGKSGCPCIGIEGLPGQVMVHLGNSSVYGYPAEVGSFCAAWDDGREPARCQDGQEPGKGNGWCAQPWCYVDPCKCDAKVLESPPEVSQRMKGVAQQGAPLYYSYATCGGEDLFTAQDKESTPQCAGLKSKDSCDEQESCTWKKNHWGEVCVGWEVAGLCGLSEHTETYGSHDCPCVNFEGLNGTIEAKIGNNFTVAYPAETGSSCMAWDMGRNPDCIGKDRAEGCDQKWCYVNSAKCSKANNAAKSIYAPGAKYQGSLLHYSYETCGAKSPKVPPQGTFALAKMAKEAAAAAARAAEESKRVAHALEAAAAKKTNNHVKFANKAYKTEWRDEWENGHVPTFREMHPNVPAGLYDRQSDGKPSAPGL